MTIFHRVFHLFPVFLIIFALAACTGTGNSPWQSGGGAPSPVINPNPLANRPVAGQAAKVAILLPLSGQHAATGQSMLQAAQLSVFDIGYDNFELLSFDTGGTPQGASAAASQAIQSGAQMILGPLFAEEVRAVKTITAPHGINMLAFSTDWTLADQNTFIMGFLPFDQVKRITAYAAAKGLTSPAILSAGDLYGTSVSAEFETQARGIGLRTTRTLGEYDSVFIPAGGTALSSILTRITNKGAQKLGTGLWDDPRVASIPDMNGAVFAAPSPSARAGFENRYAATYGTRPVRIATLAYDAAALAQALAKAGQAFTATNIMNPNGFYGMDGVMRFNKNGTIERGMSILEIRNGRIVEITQAPKSF